VLYTEKTYTMLVAQAERLKRLKWTTNFLYFEIRCLHSNLIKPEW